MNRLFLVDLVLYSQSVKVQWEQNNQVSQQNAYFIPANIISLTLSPLSIMIALEWGGLNIPRECVLGMTQHRHLCLHSIHSILFFLPFQEKILLSLFLPVATMIIVSYFSGIHQVRAIMRVLFWYSLHKEAPEGPEISVEHGFVH